MRLVVILILGVLISSCEKDPIVGQWNGSAKPYEQADNCVTIQLDIFKTENGKYHGNGTIRDFNCLTKETNYTSDISMAYITVDNPLIYFEARLDGADWVKYKFKGTLDGNSIDGKMSTWTVSSDRYDLVYKIKFEKRIQESNETTSKTN